MALLSGPGFDENGENGALQTQLYWTLLVFDNMCVPCFFSNHLLCIIVESHMHIYIHDQLLSFISSHKFKYHIWLVVWNMNFTVHNIWDNQ